MSGTFANFQRSAVSFVAALLVSGVCLAAALPITPIA